MLYIVHNIIHEKNKVISSNIKYVMLYTVYIINLK